jgi:hypothetical protein
MASFQLSISHNGSVELVRYRPDQAIRWLRLDAETQRASAKIRSKKVGQEASVNTKMKAAAEVLLDLGKSAYTEAVHSFAEANEYVLQEHQFDIIRNGVIKTIAYDRIIAIQFRNDRGSLILDKGTVTIKPFAYLTAGRIKVPIGWQRNGLDVPFELIFEEISARSGVPITSASA